MPLLGITVPPGCPENSFVWQTEVENGLLNSISFKSFKTGRAGPETIQFHCSVRVCQDAEGCWPEQSSCPVSDNAPVLTHHETGNFNTVNSSIAITIN